MWFEGAATHGVVARAVGRAADYGDVRDSGGGDGGDETSALFDKACPFGCEADHETGDVMEEDYWDVADIGG